MTNVILAIDEGTTNSKAILINETGEIISDGEEKVAIEYPSSGWVQQDALLIWSATETAIKNCVLKAPNHNIVGVGISNQRESIMIWDRNTGEPLGPVITWQCRRTAARCAELKQAGFEQEIMERTGLPLDPLFPATKLQWLIQNYGANCIVAAGTVDSWLIWKLSGGAKHATDKSNAARTQLYNIHEDRWDSELCHLFQIDPSVLPKVCDSSHIFGFTDGLDVLPDGIPIASAIGDSHAALFGHGAREPGDGKATFGTGSSIMLILPRFTPPPKGLTTTIAWSINGKTTFAFEGNILVSGSILPWTATMLGCDTVKDLLDLAQSTESSSGVSLVPAHVGLGCPHWDPDARGLLHGLSFDTTPANIARAAVESIGLQINDIYEIMLKTTALGHNALYVDGGPSSSRFIMQSVADYTRLKIMQYNQTAVSAIGAGYLAGLSVGFWKNVEAVQSLVTSTTVIDPQLSMKARESRLTQWHDAIGRTLTKSPTGSLDEVT